MTPSTRAILASTFVLSSLGAQAQSVDEPQSPCRAEEVNFTLRSYHQGKRGWTETVPNPKYNDTVDDGKKYPVDGRATIGPVLQTVRPPQTQPQTIEVFHPYNENNPGVIVGLECKGAPSLLQHPRLGIIARNSFGKPSLFLGVENTMYDGDSVKATVLTGVMPTGYKSPMPVLAFSIEGKGRFALKTDGFELRPYASVMPVSATRDESRAKNIYALGVKAVF